MSGAQPLPLQIAADVEMREPKIVLRRIMQIAHRSFLRRADEMGYGREIRRIPAYMHDKVASACKSARYSAAAGAMPPHRDVIRAAVL
jgi:hypothetical protein